MEQVKDIYPSLLLALFMGGVVFISIGFITSGIAIIGGDFNRQQLLSVHFLLAAF